MCSRAGFLGLLIIARSFSRPSFFGGCGLVNPLADADAFKVVAAVAVNRRVAAGRVVHSLFAAADGAQAEVLRQEAIAAFLALEHQILEALLGGVEQLVNRPFALFSPQNSHRLFERVKTRVLGVQDGPVEKVEESFA